MEKFGKGELSAVGIYSGLLLAGLLFHRGFLERFTDPWAEPRWT